MSEELNEALGIESPTRTSRDRTDLREPLRAWLASVLPPGAEPSVSEVKSPSANGMSSESLLFEAEWMQDGEHRCVPLVARLEPDPSDVPVFPTYDLVSQYKILQLVGQHSKVPVPPIRWLEPDAKHLGASFFIMDRIDGQIPADIIPYTMVGWMMDASDEERSRLERSTVDVLAKLHAIDTKNIDTKFLELDVPGNTALERHFENQKRYYEWARGGISHPVIEAGFEWLANNWPENEGDAVISWGDSRIGNVIYDDFSPVAILDWEMAGLAPRELDVGWLIVLHVFFQYITEGFGLPGLPNFLERDRVAAIYEELSGYQLSDLVWYEVYSALRHAMIMARIHHRNVHFEEATWPEDVDSVIPHRGLLESMIDGTYPSSSSV